LERAPGLSEKEALKREETKEKKEQKGRRG
jgi:hypothetical protein